MRRSLKSSERSGPPEAAQGASRAGSATVEARNEIALVGWRPGLAKISLTKALRQIGQLSMPEAKQSVDALLDGEKVRLRVLPPNSIEDSVRRLEELGAVVAPRG